MADGTSGSGLRDDRNVCQLCGALENLSLCGGCHNTWYCSKDHQREDWKLHKRKCKAKRAHKSTKPKQREGSSRKEAPCDSDNSKTTVTSSNLKGDESKGSEGKDKTVPNPESEDSRRSTPCTAGEAEEDCQPVISQTANSASQPVKSQTASASQPVNPQTASTCELVNSQTASDSQPVKSQTASDSQPVNPQTAAACELVNPQTASDSQPVNPQTASDSQPVNPQTASTSEPVNSQTASGEEENNQENSATSGKKKAKSVKKGSPRKETRPLPQVAEEDSERFFLDAKVFPQAAQSRHKAQTLHSAKLAMAPAGSTQAVNSKDAYLDVMLTRFDVTAKYVVNCLKTYGICVMDSFLGDVNGQEILKEVKCFKDHGLMRQGQVVHAGATSSGKIRGDIITWVDGREEHCENIRYLVSCMDAVVLKCSSLLENYTINERTKAMVACYPGNATGYVRHVDNPNQDGRCITCIYYLNKNWDVRREGGMLRIYPEGMDRVADIEPKFDRVIFFWSDRRNPHEVLPSNKERFAITVWYYEAEERARALKRFKGEVSAHPKKQAVPLFSKIANSKLSVNDSFDASR